ncbi:MAG: gfo/Idh/MocA family oxidoreductase, partial [Planctomycetota bacterium]
GLYNEQRNAVYIKDKSPKYHQWESFQPYQEKYRHTWTKSSSLGGHGGTDMRELKLFVQAVKNRTQTPIDVYEGSVPVKVPDFTRGKWKTRKPYFALDMIA